MDNNKSNELFSRAERLMPGGVNSPVRSFRAVGRKPIFMERAKGCHIYDVDGNSYIDYVCSWGPGILGHAYPQVIEKVKSACDNGLTFGSCIEKEIQLAELINEAIPSMEMMRMVSSGTEATMSAIRVARGYTGKDKIIKFRGCYHGHSDGLLVKSGSGLLTNAIPDSAGVPKSYTENTLIADFNDKNSVRKLFEQFGHEIACIIVEPIPANMGVVPPQNDYLKFLRDITNEYQALLIFDEVITGFRIDYHSAQGYFKIIPDLTTLGKIVGGGMPVGAYGGKKEIMEYVSPLGAVYQAGTLSGNPIAMTSGIETLKILKSNPNIYKSIEEKTKTLAEAYRKIKGVQVNQIGSLMSVFFTDNPVNDYVSSMKSDISRFSKYFNYMLDNGIYVAPSQFEAMFISNAHTDEDIQKTVKVIENFAKLGI
ncbi:MAG: glutamate-1-semialdehyde 2,1-aminomutase [Oscillospiraceae bacterium]